LFFIRQIYQKYSSEPQKKIFILVHFRIFCFCWCILIQTQFFRLRRKLFWDSIFIFIPSRTPLSKFFLKCFLSGQTDTRSTQNYSSEPHKTSQNLKKIFFFCLIFSTENPKTNVMYVIDSIAQIMSFTKHS